LGGYLTTSLCDSEGPGPDLGLGSSSAHMLCPSTWRESFGGL
jgi:hypothetical protein